MARHLAYGLFVVAVAALLTSCGLPAAGPQASDIVADESPQGALGGYVVVDIDERVASIDALRSLGNPSSAYLQTYRPAPDLRIGISDTVEVTIWEAATGGLFSADPGDKLDLRGVANRDTSTTGCCPGWDD